MDGLRPELSPLLHLRHGDAVDSNVRWLLERLASTAQPIVLQVGCAASIGIGRRLVDADCEVVGVDPSPVVVDSARQAIPEAIYLERDLADLDGLHPTGHRFDAAVSLFAVQVQSREAVPATLTAVRHVLRPGAAFALAVPEGPVDHAPQQFLGEQVPQTAFTPELLQQLLTAAGFDVESLGAEVSDEHTDLYARCLAG